MRIAIVGSRKYPYMAQVAEYVCSLPLNTVVIASGEGRVSSYAEWVAQERGLRVINYLVDWPENRASPHAVRTRLLVRANLDRLVAFWDGTSPGTRHVINEARKVLGFDRVEVRTP